MLPSIIIDADLCLQSPVYGIVKIISFRRFAWRYTSRLEMYDRPTWLSLFGKSHVENFSYVSLILSRRNESKITKKCLRNMKTCEPGEFLASTSVVACNAGARPTFL